MKETEALRTRAGAAAMRQAGLQKHIGPDDIGVNEFGGPVDRPVDMTFCRQMHHRVRVEARKNVRDGRTITNVGLTKVIARMTLYRCQRGETARIGQFVHDENLMIGLADQVPNQRRSDKSCPTRDDNSHGKFRAAIRAWQAPTALGVRRDIRTECCTPSATAVADPYPRL